MPYLAAFCIFFPSSAAMKLKYLWLSNLSEFKTAGCVCLIFKKIFKKQPPATGTDLLWSVDVVGPDWNSNAAFCFSP